MLTTSLGDFPLYVIEPDEEYDPEPFSYTITLKREDEGYKVYSVCNDIPCSMCAISDNCNKGENRTKALSTELKELNPELFI